MAEPSAFEQSILEMINRDRADPLGAAARQGVGLNDGVTGTPISAAPKPPLAFNPLLIDAARGHSAWELATDTYAHTGAGGSTPGNRMAAAGYEFTGRWTWGENIHLKYLWGGAVADAALMVSFHGDWFRSPGHRTNLMNDAFQEVGIGLATGEYRGFEAVAATENFARSGNKVFLTGVAYDDRDGDAFYDPGEGLGGVAVTATAADGGGTAVAMSWTSGGYALPLVAGTWRITFTGGGLDEPFATTVTIGAVNVKLDVEADALPPGAPGVVYRFYNTLTKTHFYTSSVAERDYVVRSFAQYDYEGGGFRSGQDSGGTLDVHRFYNVQTGAHFYTASAAERDQVLKTLPQFQYEGVAYRAFASATEGGGVHDALHRFYSTETKTHFYTASAAEKAWVEQTLPQFRYEFVAYFVDAVL